MSKDTVSKSPGGNRQYSPKPQHNEGSPFHRKSMEEDAAELTEDDDSEESRSDRTDRSKLSSSPETLSPSNARRRTTYKSTSYTQTETVETISKRSLSRENDAKSVKRLGQQSTKNARKESAIPTAQNHYVRNCFCCLITSIIIIGLTLFLKNGAESADVISSQADRFEIFVNDLTAIKKKFPHQTGRSWSDIRGGVWDVIHSSGKPWTFVLFSNETSVISCLAELLGAVTSKALKSNSSLILRPEDMGNEYGDAIHRLRPLIIEKKAVVVHDLLNIDAGAIQAFHSMCDRESPLVKDAIYIITIITPGYTSSQRPETFIEKILTERFRNGVDQDNLQPLITRLTDGPIIPVVPGNIPAKCSM